MRTTVEIKGWIRHRDSAGIHLNGVCILACLLLMLGSGIGCGGTANTVSLPAMEPSQPAIHSTDEAEEPEGPYPYPAFQITAEWDDSRNLAVVEWSLDNRGDLNGDSVLDGLDLFPLAVNYGQVSGWAGSESDGSMADCADINRDGIVDGLDLFPLAAYHGLYFYASYKDNVSWDNPDGSQRSGEDCPSQFEAQRVESDAPCAPRYRMPFPVILQDGGALTIESNIRHDGNGLQTRSEPVQLLEGGPRWKAVSCDWEEYWDSVSKPVVDGSGVLNVLKSDTDYQVWLTRQINGEVEHWPMEGYNRVTIPCDTDHEGAGAFLLRARDESGFALLEVGPEGFTLDEVQTIFAEDSIASTVDVLQIEPGGDATAALSYRSPEFSYHPLIARRRDGQWSFELLTQLSGEPESLHALDEERLAMVCDSPQKLWLFDGELWSDVELPIWEYPSNGSVSNFAITEGDDGEIVLYKLGYTGLVRAVWDGIKWDIDMPWYSNFMLKRGSVTLGVSGEIVLAASEYRDYYSPEPGVVWAIIDGDTAQSWTAYWSIYVSEAFVTLSPSGLPVVATNESFGSPWDEVFLFQ